MITTVSQLIITIFMCGDIMTGRGIDQILPHPSDPRIYESYLKNAIGYVKLAERKNGPISQPVNFPYIWGDALDELTAIPFLGQQSHFNYGYRLS